MTTKITTLIENSRGEHLALRTEHGISFLIEKDGHKALFDTGQSGGFIDNAAQLNLSLTDIEYAVISTVIMTIREDSAVLRKFPDHLP